MRKKIKQIISIEDWNATPENVRHFIILWKREAGYPHEAPLLNIGQCLEIISDVTRNLRKEDSDGRFFNNIFVNYESVVGFDGEEFIDTLYWEIVQSIKHLIAARR